MTKTERAAVNGPAPRRATILHSVSATCGALGALLWVRGQTGSTARIYSGYLAADSYSSSGWRVWSPAVPEARLGLYLMGAALVLLVAARLVPARRDRGKAAAGPVG
ncbi:hypothetical protein [Streptomyces fuscichromogenes]|uniref:Uncharacterized protein n=1 Tax=Streptomyces fuscichromogenes TaxID=1324013 RepID=A0A917XES4_9ACTN|nr:hypothetical protein [Streptomyces fuscichromogenes]GGN16401.1 hypothetical protein GCM10011578_044890 [Streptomyces fuscichromogenes]